MHRFLPRLAMSCVLALVTPACAFDAGGFGGSADDEGAGPDSPWPGSDDPSDDDRECFYGADDSDTPAAVIEHALEVFEGVEVVRVELILDPRFVDNTYGASSIGWQDSKKGVHTFDQLVGSDRAEILFFDGDGALAMDLEIDYLSADDSAPSGFRSLGVDGGDGDVLVGDAADVVMAITSLDRNLNERGYGDFTGDSPATTAGYTPNPSAPDWDFRVIYEVRIALDAFGAAGFGAASIEYVHASPAKGGSNTIVVDPRPCPTSWCTEPYGCTPECNDPDGCDPGPPGTPEECSEDLDCPSGELCNEEGHCAPIIG